MSWNAYENNKVLKKDEEKTVKIKGNWRRENTGYNWRGKRKRKIRRKRILVKREGKDE